MKKRFVATLLALCMLLSIAPTSAFAASLDDGAAELKQETLANDPTGSATPDETQGTPDDTKTNGAAQTPGEPSDKQPDGAKDKPDADTVPDGNGGADKQDNPDADKQDNPDGTDKKGQDKNDQKDVNAVQGDPQQVDVSATANSPQTVYVYTKVEGNNAGLQVNADGWYTIGKIELDVPQPSRWSTWVKDTDESPNYIGKSGATLTDIENALKTITRYSKNQTIDPTKITWTQLAISNGASDYTDEAPSKTYVWHLDGKISVAFVGSIVYKYYDAATNQPLEGVEPGGEVATPGSHTIYKTDTHAKSIQGYTCVGVGSGDGAYSDSTTVTVTAGQPTTVIFYYAPATYSYTVWYRDKDTGTDLINPKTGTANYGDNHLEKAANIPGYKVVGTDAVTVSRFNNDITFYYVKDLTKTKTLSYTVKHVVDGVEKFSKTYTEKVWVNAPDTIQIQAGSLDQKTYPGYKFDSMDPTTVGTSVASGTTITLNYVKDATATKELKYTVKHVVDGQEKTADTKEYTKLVWVNDPNTIEIVAGSLAKKTYTGYKFDSMDPTTVGTSVASGTTITLIYEKDLTKTKTLSYTVKHMVGGEEKFSKTYTEDVWVNAPDKITIQANSLNQNTYKGYKFVKMDPANVKVGDSVASGTIITLIYVKDDSQTQPTSYTVKYTIEGKLQNTVVVDGKAWVNDDPAKIAIKAVIAPADKYNGYKLDPKNPDYPNVGALVNTGSVFTVNYVARTDLTYTVKYLEQGTGTELHKAKTVTGQTFGKTYTEKAEEIDGYKVDAPTKDVTITTGTNEITFYYTIRTDLSYTVKYLEQGTDKELAKAKTVGNQTFNTTSDKETAIDIDGYNKVAPTSAEITIGADETKNVITFYYTARTDLTYTVNYLESGTNKPLAPAKVVQNQTFGTEVTERAIFIKGYRRVNPTKETITIGVEENVINFYYKAPGGPRFPQQPGGASGTPNTGALKSPQTGDASNLSLWFALLFVSGGVLMGTAVIGRKRKYNR